LHAGDIVPWLVEFGLLDGKIFIKGFPYTTFKIPFLLCFGIQAQQDKKEKGKKDFIHYTLILRGDIKGRSAFRKTFFYKGPEKTDQYIVLWFHGANLRNNWPKKLKIS